MRIPLYITSYDDPSRSRSKRASHLAREVAWSDRLPMLWRSLTIGPMWVDVNRDEDAGAERWLMRDGRWLIHRIITCQADAGKSYLFYAFSESMPR
jgi:hypothetical protein